MSLPLAVFLACIVVVVALALDHRRDVPPPPVRVCPLCDRLLRTCCDSALGDDHQIGCAFGDSADVPRTAEGRHEELLWDPYPPDEAA